MLRQVWPTYVDTDTPPKAPVARGQVFVASNPSTDNIRDILDAVVRLSGAKGYKIRKPADGAFCDLAGLCVSQS